MAGEATEGDVVEQVKESVEQEHLEEPVDVGVDDNAATTAEAQDANNDVESTSSGIGPGPLDAFSDSDEPYEGPCKYLRVRLNHRPRFDRGLIIDICEAVVTPGHFLLADKETIKAISDAGDGYLTEEVVTSIAEHAIIDKLAERTAYLEKNFAEMKEKYEKKEIQDVVKFCIEEDIPPLLFWRTIFETRMTKPKARKAIRADPAVLTDPIELEQVKLSREIDETTYVGKNQRDTSATYEELVKKVIDKFEIEYTTEDELKARYMEEKIKIPVHPEEHEEHILAAAAMQYDLNYVPKTKKKDFYLIPGETEVSFDGLTPDFLFDKSPLFINNKDIRWIDAKKYLGGASTAVTEDNNRKFSRYLKHFGPGAVIYHHGITSDIDKLMPKHLVLIDYENFIHATKD